MNSQLMKIWRLRPAIIWLVSVIGLATSDLQAQFHPAEKWSDSFCAGQEELCSVGDFNGDGRDDVISFVRNTQPGDAQGDVWVALARVHGPGFATRRKWSDSICSNGETCVVGDFNGDNRDDVAAFVGNKQPDPGRGDVWVSLSTGTAFGPPQRWSDFMCVGQQFCSKGDFNGDGRDDVVAFVQGTQTQSGRGDVWVALSNGSGFSPREKWSDLMCIEHEVCAVGDFNGDRYDDVIAFVRSTQTGVGEGDAWVALSNGSSFGAAQKWSDWICVRQEFCAVGDFNGDRYDDVIAFVRSTQTGVGEGDAWVALSNGSSFGAAQKWSDWICIRQETCAVGDFNRDGYADVVAFVKDTQSGAGRGDVWVALNAFPDEPSVAGAQERGGQ